MARTKWMVRAFLAALLLLGVMSSFAFAKSQVHELTGVQTSKVKVGGEEVLRVEVGVNSDGLSYRVATRSFRPKTLILELEDTIPGRLRHETKLSGTAVKLIAQEVQVQHTQLQLTLTQPVEESNYKVYTLPADKKAKKPFRLVIDIKQSGKTDGVKTKGVKGRYIVLDAGHGGSDSGAVGPSGYTEKAATLAVAKKTKAILERSGAHVIMTRETDRDVASPDASNSEELQARVNVGLREPKTDIFVSIHCNAFTNPETGGMETYYFPGSQKGYRLAKLLDEELVKAGGLANRGVKDANFYVIRHSAVPASLVELAFITNPREERLLRDSAFQDKIAKAIATAIGRYFS